MVFVHAHPDDESITTGATMAFYAAQGVRVTLITCTLGEEGEILVPELAQLEAAQADQLGGLRIGELARAMQALGVTDHRFLGGAGHFRDSGMMGSPANEHPRAFWRADSHPDVFATAVAAAVDVLREVRPQVVVTYDDNGDYGHPDHIMAHRVATAATMVAADPSRGRGKPWTVSKLYWTGTPTSVLERGYEVMSARADLPFDLVSVKDLPFGVPDELVTTVIDASAFVVAKTAALSAHRSQVVVDAPFFALSNRIGREITGVEYFRLARGRFPDDGRDADGRERDLFAGIAS
ncbi:MAG: N-acetyl-1-D-myo-inositol-2-amino-2-deoxy-alpha-D-glucopyranoside deacetylase [Actinomycetota bacterium]|nr:N-acetyl-1-D-myo-inositol-2-amino-2-deoxy-alpha-D-glucopyranoside deacetylase [Actinomycetota bacterium]